MKFSGNISNNARNRGFDFAGVLEHCLDPGLFKRIFLSLHL